MNHIQSYNVFGSLTLPGNSYELATRPTDSVYLDVHTLSTNQPSNPPIRLELRYNNVSAGHATIETPRFIRTITQSPNHRFQEIVPAKLPTISESAISDSALVTDSEFLFELNPFGENSTGARITLIQMNTNNPVAPTLDATLTPSQYTHLLSQLSNLPQSTSSDGTPEDVVLTSGETSDYPVAP